MLVHKEFSEPIAAILNTLSEKDLKKRLITENGLTIAEEEEILALDLSDTTKDMTMEEAIDYLRRRRKDEN